MAPSFGWWAKETHRRTSVIVKMENPNWSISEISPDDDDNYGVDVGGGGKGVEFAGDRPRKGDRGKNAKQITWVLLLKAHRAAGCLTSLASVVFGLASLIRRRIASGRTDSDAASSPLEESTVLRTRFYSFIKIFLWLSVVLLGFEVIAYFKGWHLGAPQLPSFVFPTSFSVQDFFGSVYSDWIHFRAGNRAGPGPRAVRSLLGTALITARPSLLHAGPDRAMGVLKTASCKNAR